MPKRYEGLSGLRGIGAVMIIAYHMYMLNGYAGTSAFGDRTVGIGGVYVHYLHRKLFNAISQKYFNRSSIVRG